MVDAGTQIYGWGMNTHHFVGRVDRMCEWCRQPDRAEIHMAYKDLIPHSFQCRTVQTEFCESCGNLPNDKVHAVEEENLLRWTTVKPTEDGYYWVRGYTSRDVILEVHPTTDTIFEIGETDIMGFHNLPDCQWQGPLKPQE